MLHQFMMPTVTDPRLEGRVDQIVSYLRQLSQELNFLVSVIPEQMPSADIAKSDTDTSSEAETNNDSQGTQEPLNPFPVGSEYICVQGWWTPAELFGGTWETVLDNVKVEDDKVYTIGNSKYLTIYRRKA